MRAVAQEQPQRRQLRGSLSVHLLVKAESEPLEKGAQCVEPGDFSPWSLLGLRGAEPVVCGVTQEEACLAMCFPVAWSLALCSFRLGHNAPVQCHEDYTV